MIGLFELTDGTVVVGATATGVVEFGVRAADKAAVAEVGAVAGFTEVVVDVLDEARAAAGFGCGTVDRVDLTLFGAPESEGLEAAMPDEPTPTTTTSAMSPVLKAKTRGNRRLRLLETTRISGTGIGARHPRPIDLIGRTMAIGTLSVVDIVNLRVQARRPLHFHALADRAFRSFGHTCSTGDNPLRTTSSACLPNVYPPYAGNTPKNPWPKSTGAGTVEALVIEGLGVQFTPRLP